MVCAVLVFIPIASLALFSLKIRRTLRIVSALFRKNLFH